MECAWCAISGERVKLFDVISTEGIIKLCKNCASEENFPILKKAGFVPKKTEDAQTVREVLTRVSGVGPMEKPKEDPELKRQNDRLKEIADKNIQRAIQEKLALTEDLVDKFHWIIMRVRRIKKLTQKELAEAIGEPEAAVKMVEEGVVSAKTPYLIEKIEKYLGVKLKKAYAPRRFVPESELFQIQTEILGKKEELPKEEEKEIRFDPITTKSLTIRDLREMKQKKEERIFERKEEMKEEEGAEKKWEEKDKDMEKDLTEKEIDDILYGRREGL